MNVKVFAALVAGAVVALSGSVRAEEQQADEKACYRKSCGGSVKGHSGSCGGTKVDAITSEKECTDAGGAWVTAAEAEKLKH